MLYQLQVYRLLNQDWIKLGTINLSSSITKKSFVSSFMISTKRKFRPASSIPKMMMMMMMSMMYVCMYVCLFVCLFVTGKLGSLMVYSHI